jgi:CBS domain-containing protein
VNEIMTWAVVTVGPAADVREAARLMHDHKLGALPVADGAGWSGCSPPRTSSGRSWALPKGGDARRGRGRRGADEHECGRHPGQAVEARARPDRLGGSASGAPGGGARAGVLEPRRRWWRSPAGTDARPSGACGSSAWPATRRRSADTGGASSVDGGGKEVTGWTGASVDIRNGSTAPPANATRPAAAASTSSRRFV